MSISPLDALLIRVQGKIESRTRRPWYDLQRTYFYRDSNGVKNIKELRKALEHFHVLVSDHELQHLMEAFPMSTDSSSEKGFDFKSFAARLYPKDSGHRAVREGRYLDEGQGGGATESFNASSSGAAFRLIGSQIAGHQPPTYKYGGAAGDYEAKEQVAPYTYTSTGAVGALAGDAEMPRLGETFNASGTTQYYTLPKKTKSKAAAKTRPAPGQARSKEIVQPRITYNRPHHARYNEQSVAPEHRDSLHYEEYFSGNPTPQSYPAEEFRPHGRYQSSTDKPRFDVKKAEPWVEVARRHNISRQYNRKPE